MLTKSCLGGFGFLTVLVSFIQINDARELTPYIVGGEQAELNKYPFVASIRRFKIHYCGSAIVSEYYVVTVAHCIFNQTFDTIDVVAGTSNWKSGGTLHEIEDIIIHELYRYETDVIADNDIGLLKLQSPITLGDKAQVLTYPTSPATPFSQALLVGYGRSSATATGPEDNLKTLQTVIMVDSMCAKLSPKRTLTFSNFCTQNRAGQGGCYGDSGTPLIDPETHAVLGLYSWVYPPCGSDIPDGYTKFWEYIDWINLHVKYEEE